jgi:hypothetical protein
MVIWSLCGYMQRLGVLCFAWTQVHINCNVSEIPNIGGMNKWLYKIVIHILPLFDRNEIYLDFFCQFKESFKPMLGVVSYDFGC